MQSAVELSVIHRIANAWDVRGRFRHVTLSYGLTEIAGAPVDASPEETIRSYGVEVGRYVGATEGGAPGEPSDANSDFSGNRDYERTRIVSSVDVWILIRLDGDRREGRTMLILLLLTALQTAPAAPAEPRPTSSGPSDVLTITVFNQPQMSGKFAVESDGTLAFPLVGRVAVGGLEHPGRRGRDAPASVERVSHRPACQRHGGAVPQSANLRDGRGAATGQPAVHRSDDADRGAGAGRVDQPIMPDRKS